MDLRNLVLDILREIDTEVKVHICSKHRGYRNSISPSLWKLKKDMKKQATHFFNPTILHELGLVNEKEYGTISKAGIMDVGGIMNCHVGTMIHALILPEIEKHLNGLGVKCITEFPVWSKETGVYGTVDMMVFNDDTMTIDIYDLKTTGDKILKRNDEIDDNYARQLYCYAATVDCMFPEWSVGELSILSICKTPNSTAYDSFGERIKLPVSAQCWVSYEELDTEYHDILLALRMEVIRICEKIKERYPQMPLWLVSDSKPCFGEVLEYPYKWVYEVLNEKM